MSNWQQATAETLAANAKINKLKNANQHYIVFRDGSVHASQGCFCAKSEGKVRSRRPKPAYKGSLGTDHRISAGGVRKHYQCKRARQEADIYIIPLPPKGRNGKHRKEASHLVFTLLIGSISHNSRSRPRQRNFPRQAKIIRDFLSCQPQTGHILPKFGLIQSENASRN